MNFIYLVLLESNKLIAPDIPWFICGLFITLIVSVMWPAKKWSAWSIYSMRGKHAVASVEVLLGILICVAVIVISGFLFRIVVIAWPAPATDSKSLLFTVPIVYPLFGAIVEEVAFRGILQGNLERWIGTIPSIIGTTICFIAAHSGNDGFSQRIGFYATLSLLCGALASKEKSVVPAIALHLVINGLMVIIMIPGIPLYLQGLPLLVVGVATALLPVVVYFLCRLLTVTRPSS